MVPESKEHTDTNPNKLTHKIIIDINTMSCPIKVNGNTIELTVHTSCYCVLDLLCVNRMPKIPPWIFFLCYSFMVYFYTTVMLTTQVVIG